jgi:glycerate kinase
VIAVEVEAVFEGGEETLEVLALNGQAVQKQTDAHVLAETQAGFAYMTRAERAQARAAKKKP